MSVSPRARRVPEPTEIIQLPRPSWAPLFLALGLTAMLCGVFITFMGPSWFYVAAGAVVALAAFRSMVAGARRDYFRLPRRREVQSATLPADSIRQTKRSA